MSFLTKVFVLLVSLLSIFLSGIVVSFVLNTNNWKMAYDKEVIRSRAAQVQAVVAEESLSKGLARRENIIAQLNDKIIQLETVNNSLVSDMETLLQEKAIATNQSFTAVTLSGTLRETIDNMYKAQQVIQKDLREAHENMLVAQKNVTELRRSNMELTANNDQLELVRKQQVETIARLENDLDAQLQSPKVKGEDWLEKNDSVTQLPIYESGVPIRGQVTAVEQDLASISIGSSSGVRKNMKFLVYRNEQYLGDLQITHVEPSESAGRINLRRGLIVKGDSVTTGFN